MAKGGLNVWLLYVFYWSSGGNGQREGGAGGRESGYKRRRCKGEGRGKAGKHGTGGVLKLERG